MVISSRFEGGVEWTLTLLRGFNLKAEIRKPNRASVARWKRCVVDSRWNVRFRVSDFFRIADFELRFSDSIDEQEQPADFVQPRAGFLLLQPWETPAHHHEVAAAREHELVLLALDDADVALGGEHLEHGHLQQ